MNSRLFNPQIFLPLALLIALCVAPLAAAGTRGSDGLDRGDNPAVGSLPVEVDDDLLYDVVYQCDEQNAGRNPRGFRSLLMLVGAEDLGRSVLGASGEPSGYVDDADDWSLLAVRKRAQVMVDRADAAAADFGLVQWLSPGYVGGSYTLVTSVTSREVPISQQLTPLPLRSVALLPGVNGSASLTFSPAPGNEHLPTIHVTLMASAGVVAIQYQP